jgi:ABC-type sugar transport system ATPase subunit
VAVCKKLAFAPDPSIWANVFRTEERLVSGPLSLLVRVDRKAMMEYSAEKLDRTRIRLASVASRVGQVSVGRRQLVAVGRAVV